MSLTKIRPSHFPSRTLPAWLSAVVWLFFFATAWTADLRNLPGHVPSATARLAPVGRLDGTKRLHLSISLPARDPDGLTRLLHDLYDPTSPQFRHFITPTQFATQFGPTEQGYQALVDFAKANGLSISTTHPNRLVLGVDGAVSDIEKTFHITMRTYQHPKEGRQFYAPDRDPSVNFAQPILHISGLDNYALPRPNLKARPAGQAKGTSDSPAANSGSGPSGNYAGNDFRAAYVPGTTLTGTGQSVGLLEFDAYYSTDITNYETQFGLPNVPLVNVAIDGGVSVPGQGNGEVALDIEMVLAMAPGVSTIYVYESSGS
ncbi:MAG: protease pro-enzyme activation domain-containing protein [Chthoniobacter sp.]|nr:protease pro-enzyme activation domain-containing protein [Chthoniobacter sp.]